MQEVTSEIYQEYDYITKAKPHDEKNVISEFPFILPKFVKNDKVDKDDDLDIIRPTQEIIKIEHREDTNIALVGLQVWRGAFLLGDLLIHLGLKGELRDKVILEVGAGTGITSFVAAMYAKKVICTDIDIGGILSLIDLNSKYNSKFIQSEFKIMPLDFNDTNWNEELERTVDETDIILAADVIYDDEVTSAFVKTMQKLLKTKSTKQIYLAIEKRYVFTIEHLDTVAPCYENFMALLDEIKNDQGPVKWEVVDVPLDFPKLFRYERVNELVLLKITSVRASIHCDSLVS